MAVEAVNYAAEYSQALAQEFPYVLNYGALYATPNNNRYRWINAKTIEIPNVRTTGRVNANRDTIAQAQRNYDNSWETKTLTNQRKWSTLVHPMDIDQTNMVASIANITQTFNQYHKFPEMDAYLISTLYKLWTTEMSQDQSSVPEGLKHTVTKADETELSADNVLTVFDNLMLNMDNARVPANGRILYCTNEVKTMLKNATKIDRDFDVQSSADMINRTVNRLDEVQVIGVPKTLMMSEYEFTEDWKPKEDAQQINMFLVHPNVVITPVSYTFSRLDPPSAGSEGKYIYYEESFEDVFILNRQADGIQFNITASP